MCGMTAGSERNEQNALLITCVNDTFHSMPIGTSFITWFLLAAVETISLVNKLRSISLVNS